MVGAQKNTICFFPSTEQFYYCLLITDCKEKLAKLFILPPVLKPE